MSLQGKEKAGESEDTTQESSPEIKADPEAGHPEDGAQENEEDEEDLLGKFEKELEDILLPKSEMAKLKEEVKTEMEKEFDNIMDEVRISWTGSIFHSSLLISSLPKE